MRRFLCHLKETVPSARRQWSFRMKPTHLRPALLVGSATNQLAGSTGASVAFGIIGTGLGRGTSARSIWGILVPQ